MGAVALIFPIVAMMPSLPAVAAPGVGISTGKIEVEENLQPGARYHLPSLAVINTGDETAEYEVGLAFHSEQPELRPDEDWFSYTPRTFTLEPGAVQEVAIDILLPITVESGQYFAYLEGRPVQSSTGSTVGIAAAAKLHFSVSDGDLWSGLSHRLPQLWAQVTPWLQIAAVATLGVMIALIAKKRFKLVKR